MKIIYKTRATSTGGRACHSALDDGSLSFDLAPPGSGKKGANPEQLFAIGYAACFDNALAATAPRIKKSYKSSKTSAQVGIGQLETGGYGLDVELDIELHGISEADAKELVEKTHTVCPYSNAIHGNIDVRLKITAHP
jgi:osmotically inducible protein OsmC